jgi:hypothetical protein
MSYKLKLVLVLGAHLAGAAIALHCQLQDRETAFKLLLHGALLLIVDPNPAHDTISSCANPRIGSCLIVAEERCY